MSSPHASPPPTSPAPHRLSADRLELISLVATIAALVIVGIWTIHPWLGLHNSDGATYYLLGFSLAKAGAYLLPSTPTPEPVFNFPPLWPLMIAGVMKLVGSYQPAIIVPTLKWLSLAFYMAAVALVYALYRRRAPGKVALITALVMAVNGVAHRYLGDALADIPYLLLSTLFLVDFVAGHQDAGGPFSGKGRAWRLLALLAAAPILRPVGLTLGAAAAASELLNRRWKSALLAILASVSLYGGWLIAEHHYRTTRPAGDPALQAFVDASPVKISFLKYFAARRPADENDMGAVASSVSPLTAAQDAAHRLEQYARMTGEALWPLDTPGARPPGVVRVALTLLALGLILWGFRALWRDPARAGMRVLPLYCALYGLLILAYPYVSARYLLPILPWLVAAYFTGATALINAVEQTTRVSRRPATAAAGMAITLTLAVTALTAQMTRALPEWFEQARVRTNAAGPQSSARTAALYDVLRQLQIARDAGRIPPDAVLIARKPELAFFYTGIHAKRFPFYDDPQRLFQWIAAQGSVYILEDGAFKESRRLLAPALARNRARLSLTLSARDQTARVWKIAP